MGVSTRAKAEDPKKMKKSSSASRILAMMKSGKPTVAPKPKAPPKVAPKPQAPPKVAPKPKAPPKVAPKPTRSERPIVPPKPPRRKSQPFRQNSGSDGIGLVERSKSIRSPKRRSSGRLPKPTKTPGWSSPNEESFKRPAVATNRRTSIYQKRIRQSLFDNDVPFFSPSKTRRRSVYGPLPANSPPKPRPRRSMAPPTSRLPTPLDSYYEPVHFVEPIREEPLESPKPPPKKRRPVCGVAALRRQSAVPEVVPERGPVLVCESFQPRNEVDCRNSRLDENVLDKSVEIVEMDKTPLLTPPGLEAGDGDGDFFTPAGRALVETSLYETPAVKVNKVGTPSCRLPASVSTRRHKTPRRTGNVRTVPSADYEILPVHLLEPLELNKTLVDDASPGIVNDGHNMNNGDKNDSSKCVVS